MSHTVVKAIVKIESQGFDGTLNVTCIEGGPITQLDEMPRIMEEAKGDCSMSGITVRYQITKINWKLRPSLAREFLSS